MRSGANLSASGEDFTARTIAGGRLDHPNGGTVTEKRELGRGLDNHVRPVHPLPGTRARVNTAYLRAVRSALIRGEDGQQQRGDAQFSDARFGEDCTQEGAWVKTALAGTRMS